MTALVETCCVTMGFYTKLIRVLCTTQKPQTVPFGFGSRLLQRFCILNNNFLYHFLSGGALGPPHTRDVPEPSLSRSGTEKRSSALRIFSRGKLGTQGGFLDINVHVLLLARRSCAIRFLLRCPASCFVYGLAPTRSDCAI